MVDAALNVIREQIQEAIDAPKCHGCGCLHKTVEALADTELGKRELAAILDKAKSVFVTRKYDCLGCPVCYPAIAANAFTESHPESAAELDLCPTEAPDERMGWPPFPGDYQVLRYRAPVAVCTLNSPEMATELWRRSPEGLSVVGTMHTENLGIERLIRNVNANPNIRFLILCGEDTQQRIGHLPGQSLGSLLANGIDERGRIIGAQGKRPVLKNVTADEVSAFRRNVELVNLAGEKDIERISDQVAQCAGRNPGSAPQVTQQRYISTVFVNEIKPLMLDPAGYLVIYPEQRRSTVVLEHYTNQGVLDAVLEGHSAGALYQAAITRKLVSRLDHAAYLGRELARAEHSLRDGSPYVQDGAPEHKEIISAQSCGCTGGSCP